MSERTPLEIGRIVATPGVCAGKPRIAGTRIPCSTIWSMHKDATSPEAIRELYPYLELADVLAAIAWGQGYRWKRRKRLSR